MLSKHSRTSLSIPGIDRCLRNEFCVILPLDVVLPEDKPILWESMTREKNLYNKYNYLNIKIFKIFYREPLPDLQADPATKLPGFRTCLKKIMNINNWLNLHFGATSANLGNVEPIFSSGAGGSDSHMAHFFLSETFVPYRGLVPGLRP